jgi:hypothetical protein
MGGLVPAIHVFLKRRFAHGKKIVTTPLLFRNHAADAKLQRQLERDELRLTHSIVIARSDSDEAIQLLARASWIASLRSQ